MGGEGRDKGSGSQRVGRELKAFPFFPFSNLKYWWLPPYL